MLAPWKQSYDKPRQCIKKQTSLCWQRSILSNYGFSVFMYTCELNHKEVWEPKNWCFWNVVLEKTLESPLDSKEIKPINPKWNQLWIFIGRNNTKVEAPRVWSFDVKSRLIGKDPDAGKGWSQEEKRDNRGWDDLMASPTQWAWVWASSRNWWWTGKSGMLQSMGLQRAGHNWATEMNTCGFLFYNSNF